MNKRSLYVPFYRINRSVLPLGITWEDLAPSLIIFLTLSLLFRDALWSFFSAGIYLFFANSLRKKHRSRILEDFFISLILGKVIYVYKFRTSFKN